MQLVKVVIRLDYQVSNFARASDLQGLKQPQLDSISSAFMYFDYLSFREALCQNVVLKTLIILVTPG